MLAPLIRLLFQQMFTELQEQERTKKDRFDVLFLLDEFASLGRMDELGHAITTVRSSGAHLMRIVQSLANLQVYGREGAANFMGNCELQLFMAPTDSETPRYISEAIGQRTYAARTRSWRQAGFEPASISERHEGASLIRPEEVRLLGPDAAIALVRDQNPIALRKVRWFKGKRLRRLHAAQGALSFEIFAPAEMPRAPRSGEIFELVAPKAEPAENAGASVEAATEAPNVVTEAAPEVEQPVPPLPAAPPAKMPSQPERPLEDRALPAVDEAVPATKPSDEAPAPTGLVNLRDRSRDLARGIRRYKAEAKRGSAADGGE